MFGLLVQAKQMLQASFMGSEGIDGGQGDADHIYGESKWGSRASSREARVFELASGPEMRLH